MLSAICSHCALTLLLSQCIHTAVAQLSHCSLSQAEGVHTAGLKLEEAVIRERANMKATISKLESHLVLLSSGKNAAEGQFHKMRVKVSDNIESR